MVQIKLQDLNFYGDPSSTKCHISKHIAWDRSAGAGPIVFFTDLTLTLAQSPLYKNSKKIAWLLEPFPVNPYPYQQLVEQHNNFDLILTHNTKLVQMFKDKAEYVPNIMHWVDEKDWKIHPKTKLI